MIWDNMINFKKFLISGLITLAVLLPASKVFAAQTHKVPTVAVLSDTGHRNGTKYLICGAASDIIAADIINRLNATGRIKAPLLGETMSKITGQNISLYYNTFFQEYKYNYNIDFVNLKRVTKNINADYILMVTSGLDVQSNFLKDTWWNKLAISGMDPVKPTYKLTTLVALIDKKTYSVVWQDLYLRDISAHNYDLGIVQFSPSYAQLSKIKSYSKNMSEYVTNIVDAQVNPWIVPPQKPKSFGLGSKFVNEGTKVTYPVVNGKVIRQNYRNWNEKQKLIQEQKQRQKIEKQNQYIQNVNYKKQKEAEQKPSPKTKDDEKLFDSIRNNIEDVSNTLPATKEKAQEENIKPAVNVQPSVKKEEVKVIKPVMNKPNAKKEVKQEPKEQAPSYDWNLKNIYLQKIGNV